ncbi:helix-turn-helix domain-containing protein [Streptomyces sp. WI04-05B]|uniref:helix-turn-helix domain-containing protein n=1 Tax=Streptomyces TaxID=1883 RepID=UPI0029B94351|nr:MULTISPECIES: helix-turn-helix transcriptional regulator [unclassified Streptomyces]MDX2543845.1 helix-turn-helix transcriptional regulator [Streptomyces sp. WI04-05B]MDX2582065.1 helix-turn-helix transcriptional regulator [Streptomyces sp. WI04-05A]MDX3752477.1 helix-turn-helix transcriptional regulator [Streptomyces sp. AK08-02]
MAPRSQPTARQVRLGTELRRMREAAGLKAREAAGLLSSTSAQMSQVEAGLAGVSEERVRRLAAHYACGDNALIDALAAMVTDRTQGWWEEFEGLLPPVFSDVAELEHHATFLHEVVITHVPGLLQTPDYARAVFGYMVPQLPESELTPRVQHRMNRRAVIERDPPAPYRTVIHEAALRIRVADRKVMLAQLHEILSEMERGHVTVRVVPFDTDWFAGASAAMMHLGGPLPRLDTVLRDSPSGTAFLDAESQLDRFRTLFRKVEGAALDPAQSRDFIHRLAKKL